MIPPDTSRAFGSILASPSPRLTEVDLAKIIDRTVKMAIAAKRQLGFAAVTTGCDGVRRTSMFDGSACQTEGDSVCIAERQDGITACLQVPMQGSGIVFQSISFRSVPCAPVTGWYVLDDDGFLYRIPAGLIEAYAYWPPEWLPSSPTYDLVRSGTWGRLMCADELGMPALHGFGGGGWIQIGIGGGEGVVYMQQFSTAIGGDVVSPETNFYTTHPTVTNGVGRVTVSAFGASFAGTALSRVATDTLLGQTASNGALTPGREYRARLYAYKVNPTTLGVGVIKGPSVPVGTSTTPTLTSPSTRLSLASVLVSYGTAPVLSALTYPVGGVVTNADVTQISPAILLRDSGNPNAGQRLVDITLPSADSGVVAGAARVAFGYPLALEILWGSFSPGAPAVAGSPYGAETMVDVLARPMYDQAFVYRPRLGIEYSVGHLNVAGPSIVTPGANELLSTIDPAGPLSQDIGANVLQLPNGEIGLVRPYTDGGTPMVPRRIERYRVRPAPTDSATFAVSHQALGPWGLDPNAWVARRNHDVANWTPGDTSFTCAAGWTHGRGVPCVLWQSSSAQRHPSADPTALYGTLGEPVGLVCPIDFGGAGAPALQPGTNKGVTVLGPDLVLAYAWTFTLNGIESALSPIALLVQAYPSPATATYTLTVTVPLGPAGTTERTIYRFGFDQDLGNDGYTRVSPWDPRTGTRGAVYDRMMVRVGAIQDNATTAWVDDVTTLTYSGDRPPSPFIGPIGAGIVVGGPSNTYLLPPVEL